MSVEYIFNIIGVFTIIYIFKIYNFNKYSKIYMLKLYIIYFKNKLFLRKIILLKFPKNILKYYKNNKTNIFKWKPQNDP